MHTHFYYYFSDTESSKMNFNWPRPKPTVSDHNRVPLVACLCQHKKGLYDKTKLN